MDDFGLESRGYKSYPDSEWPQGLLDFVAVTKELNNNREFRPEEKKDARVPRLELFDGDDKFATYGITRALLPSGSQDRRVSKVVAAFLYAFKNRTRINLPVLIGCHMSYTINNNKISTLPYGMLVTHIMKKWDVVPYGRALPSSTIHIIGITSIKHQKLVMFRGRLLCTWQIREASEEDRAEIAKIVGKRSKLMGVDTIQGDDVHEGGDNIEGDDDDDDDDDGNEVLPQRVSTVRRNEEFVVREELRRLSERQDSLMRTQKKHGKYLKGIMKFLRCLGGEGSSDAAQRYLQHSDSDAE